jgi:hypothetical protein
MNRWKRVVARRAWPNALGSRLLQAKTQKMKFARSVSGLPRGSKGWGQVGEARAIG